MQTTKEAKVEAGAKQPHHEFTHELRDSLIEQGKAAAEEHRRIEMTRLKEEVDARHALLTSLEPNVQEQVARAMKARSAATVVHAPSTFAGSALRPFPPGLGFNLPVSIIDFGIMRPPFTPEYFQPASRHTQRCYDVPNKVQSNLLLQSWECDPYIGALSLECAIGLVNHNWCGSGGIGLFGWWENSTSAFMTFLKQPRVRVPSMSQLVVEVDYAIEGPAQWWALFMIPGEAGNNLGLVGGLGMANLSVSANIQGNQYVQRTYERFLLGSATPNNPGGSTELKQTFTLSTSLSVPGDQTLNWYQIYLDAQLSVFQSDGIAGKYPGFAQANLTTPGSTGGGGSIGPSAPLKVKEIRTALISF